jgi:hypothetical protein
MAKLACNLDKDLSTFRHQGFIKKAKRPKNPTKTYLRRRHQARKYMAKTCPYQAPNDYQEVMTKVQQE